MTSSNDVIFDFFGTSAFHTRHIVDHVTIMVNELEAIDKRLNTVQI